MEEFPCKIKLNEHIEAKHKEQEKENATDEGKGIEEAIFAKEGDKEIDNFDSLEKVLIPSSTEFRCEICRIYFAHMKDLENHLDTVHLEELKCGFCNIEFQGINDMDDHMDLKHKGMWKLNDPDILRKGDSEYENEFEED